MYVGNMFIAQIRNKSGNTSYLLREGYREDGKVKTRTLLSLSHLPIETIEAMRLALSGNVAGGEPIHESSLPHGHVLAVTEMIKKLGVDRLFKSRPHHKRDLAMALVAGRILEPCSKLALAQSLAKGAEHNTLGEVLNLGELGKAVDPDNPESSREKRAVGELYAAMDWMLEQQPKVEEALAKRHLRKGCAVLYDLSSSYFEGHTCPLARYGYSRDKRGDRPQVNYGLLCSEEGIPVAIEVVEGNVGDPKTIPAQVDKLKERFGLDRVIVVGDRGMVTEARIRENIATADFEWISALTHRSLRPLMEAKVITPGLFDERGIAEIAHPDYPGERLIACFNPIAAEDHARKRAELMELTEKALQKAADACSRERNPLRGAVEIGMKAGAALARWRMAGYFEIKATEDSLTWTRNEEKLAMSSAMDGIYVIRTSMPKEAMSDEKAVLTYKRLSRVERAFRTLKGIDLQVRPIYHRLEHRVRGHLFLCMLAYYVEWHLRQA